MKRQSVAGHVASSGHINHPQHQVSLSVSSSQPQRYPPPHFHSLDSYHLLFLHRFQLLLFLFNLSFSNKGVLILFHREPIPSCYTLPTVSITPLVPNSPCALFNLVYSILHRRDVPSCHIGSFLPIISCSLVHQRRVFYLLAKL
ncbi:unnamed protein product [Nezara viridula]|uniref:Uncharacterized protein n=1 Tax=Nezara viridula TaxID=85310 RepID=A0A9P0GZC4_NEZVI|nr:unnamed protein product [Nezara viridula]